jgi:hypothetical protein
VFILGVIIRELIGESKGFPDFDLLLAKEMWNSLALVIALIATVIRAVRKRKVTKFVRVAVERSKENY